MHRCEGHTESRACSDSFPTKPILGAASVATLPILDSIVSGCEEVVSGGWRECVV